MDVKVGPRLSDYTGFLHLFGFRPKNCDWPFPPPCGDSVGTRLDNPYCYDLGCDVRSDFRLDRIFPMSTLARFLVTHTQRRSLSQMDRDGRLYVRRICA